MKKQIGVVGVDSGSLIILDPCYIRDEVIPQMEGNERHFSFWGRDQNKVAVILINEGWEVEKGNLDFIIRNVTAEQVMKLQGRLTKLNEKYLVLSDIKTGSFEDKLFDIRTGEEQAGQVNYKLGHPGLAVVFSSGMGDGVYPVYAHYSDGRITKIEIVF